MIFGIVSAGGQDRLGDLGKIELFPGFDAAFAGGQGKERADESFLVLAEDESLLAHGSQRFGVGIGVGDGDFQEGLEPSEGGAQFV